MKDIREVLHKKLDSVLDSEDPTYFYSKALVVVSLLFWDIKDKGDKSYTRHLYRVAEKIAEELGEYWGSAALLHDTVEDTEAGRENLSSINFKRDILDVVDALTKNPSRSYEENIIDILKCKHREAVQIKIADLLDNLDLTRIKDRFSMSEETSQRIINYINALNILGYRR